MIAVPKKKTSSQCVMYRLIWHEDLLDLAREVYERTYRPTTSTCFIVTRPKLREVFAANFRDRIVQHWLCLRLEPLFEARFVEHGNVSFNCRKGFGTFACIDQLTKNTIEVSDNYSHEAWYAQFDIKGFFMSIDCERLLEHLLPFIKEKWNYWKGTIYEQDLDLVLWLTEIIVRHRPQDDCIRQGNLKLWRILPKNKSLFYNEWMKGEPIGNLTSQLFANFYMSFFDEWAIKAAEERGAKYVRFVDDFSFVCKTKEDAIYFKRASRNQLRYILNIQMHPNKIYIQEVKKGIKMVGGVIKPGRAYLSNRTVGNFINAVSYLEEACKNCDKEAIYANVRSINSYLGFLIHYQSYGIRRKAFSELHYFWKACYIQGKFQVVKVASGEGRSLSQLSDEELIAARAYLNQIKFAGVKCNVVSRRGDVLVPRVTVYYDGAITKEELYDNIDTALIDFIVNIDIDSLIYSQKIIDAIQKVEHVTDVHIDQEASVEQGIFIAQYNDNNELGPLTKIERKCYLASGYAKQSTQQDAESELPTFREAIVIKLETE